LVQILDDLAQGEAVQPPRFILDFAASKAILKSLKLRAQGPEPLARLSPANELRPAQTSPPDELVLVLLALGSQENHLPGETGSDYPTKCCRAKGFSVIA
jgi:hypothetical protein